LYEQSFVERALIWLKTQSPAKYLTSSALLLAAFDTFVRPISLTALGLIVLAGVPWLIPILKHSDWPLKSMKLPGGVEFEFSELMQIGEQAESAGLLKQPEHKYSFEAIFYDDPNLAMAGLRIELEKRLVELAQIGQVDIKTRGIGRLVRALEQHGALDHQEVSVIADLMPTLNKAVHAQGLDERAFDWAIEVGPQLLAGLDEKIQNIVEACT